MTSRLQITARINVTKWEPDAAVLGRALANDPAVIQRTNGLANQIVQEATKTLNGLGQPRPLKRGTHPRFKNKFWSRDPKAVAKMVRSHSGQVFPLRASSVDEAKVTRVALVTADHPYSWAYEFGAWSIRSSAFMRGAIRKVWAQNQPGVTLRRYNRNAALRSGGNP
jgi:hypothetical protein